MTTFQEAKTMITTLASCGDVEFEISLNGQEYMIIQYKDCCAFQRCGYTNGSGEVSYPTLDHLYESISIDGICLKKCWEHIEYMTINGNKVDDFPYIFKSMQCLDRFK